MDNRIFIVDDHPVIRMAIQLTLTSEGYDVIGEADNGADALEFIEKFCPSTLILDIGIPVIDGLTVIRTIAKKNLPVKVVVLTGLPSRHLAWRCRKMGAHAFISKQTQHSELAYAVRTVQNNKKYYPDIPCPEERPDSTTHEHEQLQRLSACEFRVMQQLLQGMKNKDIASAMLLSPKTTSTYKTRIYQKLQINNLIDLHSIAKRNDLI